MYIDFSACGTVMPKEPHSGSRGARKYFHIEMIRNARRALVTFVFIY